MTMELNVVGGSPIQVSEVVFNRPYSEALVHQIVTAYRNAGRSGTKAQKTRSQMSGTTKKFKKQKGGGARHGDYRAPIFVGGGRAFAASPRSFAQKVNRKMYRGAMQAILSELIRQDRVKVISALDVAAPKTKNFVAKLAELGVTRATFVASEVSEAAYLAARNIPHVHVVDVHGLNPASLVGTDNLVLTVDAVKKIEEWLS
jgi:large subunit ribosomal protein L4